MIKREILTSRKVFQSTTHPTHPHEHDQHFDTSQSYPVMQTLLSANHSARSLTSTPNWFTLVYPKISDTDSQSDLAKFKKEKNVKRNVIVMLLL